MSFVKSAAASFIFTTIAAAVPLSFEPNQGQAAAAVQFVSRGPGYALYLGSGEAVLKLDAVRMSLLGGSVHAHAEGLARQSGVVNYLIGNDPKKWRTGIPTYGKVRYAQIYPGVDLLFYGNQRQLEYDFVVAPGADISRIAWRIDGARASLDAQGNLVLDSAVFKKPVLYQMDGGKRISVEGSFAVAGNRVGFRIGRYDHSKPLTIDPVLSYVSYLDGSSNDTIGRGLGPGNLEVGVTQGLALDSAGSVYVTGSSLSLDFPMQNPYQAAPPAKLPGVAPGAWYTAFVSKFSPDGSSLVYSTYLGGEGEDYGYAIAVDSSGSAYVTGLTTSNTFPITSGAYQTVCGPDPTDNPPPYSASCNGSIWSVYVTKLNPAGNGLVYSTYLGGYGLAYATAIAVDAAGNAYIAGNEDIYCQNYTFAGCFPTTFGAVIPGSATGGRSPQYAFVAAFDPTGSKLLYSTLFGDLNGLGDPMNGAGDTYGTGVAVDANGYFYLIGDTNAGVLPTTPGVIQPTSGPLGPAGTYVQGWRGFVAKFYPLGYAVLNYATYLGGQTANLNDFTSGITFDGAGNAYIAGSTSSKDFPVTSGAYQTVCGPNGQNCAADYVAVLNPSGSAILWATFVGGGKPDASDGVFASGPIQLDGNGNVYIMGLTSTGFEMANSIEPFSPGGQQEVMIAELDPTGSTLLFSTIIGSNALDEGTPAGLAVDATGNIYVAGNTTGPNLITTPGAFQTATSSGVCCWKGFVARIAAQGTAGVALTSAQSGPLVVLTTTVTKPQKYASMPTGTVSYLNGDSVFFMTTLDATGTAVFSSSTLPPGTYTVTAQYNGDTTYAPGSAALTFTVH
jgi:hypothetical protein